MYTATIISLHHYNAHKSYCKCNVSPSHLMKCCTAAFIALVFSASLCCCVTSWLLTHSWWRCIISHTPSSLSIQQQEQDPTNLYISNLPVSMDEQELENMLKPLGHVISTRILRDANGVSRGVGFARYAKMDALQLTVLSVKSFSARSMCVWSLSQDHSDNGHTDSGALSCLSYSWLDIGVCVPLLLCIEYMCTVLLYFAWTRTHSWISVVYSFQCSHSSCISTTRPNSTVLTT